MKIDAYNCEELKSALDSNEEISFGNGISTEDLLKTFSDILIFEEKEENKDNQSNLNLKNLDADKLASLYKFWMRNDNIERLRNSTIILNIILLLKTYNTFDNGFFIHPLIFISSIDKYLDVKLDLQKEIQEVNCQIGVYFMSLMKSLSKTEYTMLDSYVEIPYFYKSVFISMDLVTISGILSTIPDDYQFKTVFVKDANLYMSKLAKNYVMSDVMMKDFLTKGCIEE